MAKADQDQHLKWSLQRHILFLKVFFGKKHSRPPGKYPWQELIEFTQALIFFLIPPFQNLGLKVVPQQKGMGWAGGGEGADTAIFHSYI